MKNMKKKSIKVGDFVRWTMKKCTMLNCIAMIVDVKEEKFSIRRCDNFRLVENLYIDKEGKLCGGEQSSFESVIGTSTMRIVTPSVANGYITKIVKSHKAFIAQKEYELSEAKNDLSAYCGAATEHFALEIELTK